MADSEFIESGCDEKDEDQPWYPSESSMEEWKLGKEKSNKCKESLKQGHCLPQLGDIFVVYLLHF